MTLKLQEQKTLKLFLWKPFQSNVPIFYSLAQLLQYWNAFFAKSFSLAKKQKGKLQFPTQKNRVNIVELLLSHQWGWSDDIDMIQ